MLKAFAIAFLQTTKVCIWSTLRTTYIVTGIKQDSSAYQVSTVITELVKKKRDTPPRGIL